MAGSHVGLGASNPWGLRREARGGEQLLHKLLLVSFRGTSRAFGSSWATELKVEAIGFVALLGGGRGTVQSLLQ